MNSKQRRKEKRRALRMADRIIDIALILVREVEQGDKTLIEAEAELTYAKTEIKAL